MILWGLCFFTFIFGISLVLGELGTARGGFRIRNELRGLEQVIGLLHEIQETLEAGAVPARERWEAIKKLNPPWGDFASGSLEILRTQGGALLPTLKRLRNLAESHHQVIKDARTKTSQALAQVFTCIGLVPLFGGALYIILPGMKDHLVAWISGCLGAIFLSACGGFWIFSMAKNARWGGLHRNERPWVLAVFCAGERFLALVRSGVPADLAWTKSCEFLTEFVPELAQYWGHSVWENEPKIQGALSLYERNVRETILNSSISLRRAIQVSLIEGRPCLERAETVLHALRQDVRVGIDRQLSMLAMHALKPLFLCVAPALLGLLSFGLYLACLESGGVLNGFF